jgi:hypothetical protein
MIELKRLNVHKVVETKERALRLISDGFEVVEDKLNLLGVKVEKVVEDKIEATKTENKEKNKK